MEVISAQIRLHGTLGILTYCLLSLGHKTFEIHCTTDTAKAGSNLQFGNFLDIDHTVVFCTFNADIMVMYQLTLFLKL